MIPPSQAPDILSDAAVIAEHFAGDAALYATTRPLILTQLVADLQSGDAALARGDHESMGRVVHDMKSALSLIGQAAMARLARELEAKAASDRCAADLATGWARLSAAVRSID